MLNTYLDRAAVYQGRLEKIYSTRKIEGYKTVDIYFNEMLSTFRLALANNIYMNNLKERVEIRL